MFKFLKKLLKSEDSSEKDDIFHYEKNKLEIEDVTLEENFYVHKYPKQIKEVKNMPMQKLENDIVSGENTFIDPDTKEQFNVSPQEALRMVKGDVPDGIIVPGVRIISNRQPNQPARQDPNRPSIPINVGSTPQPQRNVPIGGSAPSNYPPTETAMVEDAYHIFIDLPGVKKETLKIIFEDSSLVVSGQRESSIDILRNSVKKPYKKKDPIVQSHSSVPTNLLNNFEFKYPFKKQIDESAMQAQLDSGILHVTLPHRVKGEQVNVPIM